MRTRRMTFEEVKLSATHKWKDEDGKKRQITKNFTQTINPYNVNADGQVKTRTEIITELAAAKETWLKEQEAK